MQRAQEDPSQLTSAEVDVLQRTIGLRAAQRMLGIPSPFAGPVQAKLTVGPVGDNYEQEADHVAAQVMAAPTHTAPIAQRAGEEDELQAKPLASTITPLVQREAMLEEEEIQTKALVQRSGDGFEAGADFEERLEQRRAVVAHPCPPPRESLWNSA